MPFLYSSKHPTTITGHRHRDRCRGIGIGIYNLTPSGNEAFQNYTAWDSFFRATGLVPALAFYLLRYWTDHEDAGQSVIPAV
jgi:hypothetical protein